MISLENLGSYSDIYETISFKLCMIIETTEFYTFISVWMVLAFIQDHICARKKIGVHFLANTCIDFNDSTLAQPGRQA